MFIVKTLKNGRSAPFFIFLFIFFGLFGLTKISLAADYYVSPTGQANWQNCQSPEKSGTAACAPATAMANAAAGDLVYFRGGNYYPPTIGTDKTYPSWYPANAGSSGSPIIMQAYPGETATIYQPSDGAGAIGSRYNWNVWDGFIIVKSVTTGANGVYRSGGGDNIVIRNNEIIGNEAADSQNQVGIYIEGAGPSPIYCAHSLNVIS